METVLLSGPIDEEGMKVLKGKVRVMVSPDSSEASVGQRLKEAEGLIVRTATRITADMIRGAGRLKVISRTGGGLNNVDVDAATAQGVVVCGVKGPQDRFVAEHAVSMMGALAKAFYRLDPKTRRGEFKSRFEYLPAGLEGKCVGLIGLGRIGRIVAGICIDGFKMTVRAFDPYLDPRSLGRTDIIIEKKLESVVAAADFLSLHIPLTAETRGLMNRERFALMKSTAFVINTSRGEVIEESAMTAALQNGRIAGAGLDVYEKEPPEIDNPLFRLENVIVTPHSAGLTKDTVARLAAGAALNILNVFEGRRPSYSPNWELLQKG